MELNLSESAFDIMDRLKKIHVPSLFSDNDRAYSYKLISIYEAMAEISLPGDFAEFGVYKGRCAHFISNFLTVDRRLHLFDSFEGLPEDWANGRWKAGAFRLGKKKIPEFASDRIVLYKGWFKDTVPAFAASLVEPLAFIHMDADLYGSTLDALLNIDHLIAPGTVILFDEYVMKETDDEHRALVEWARKFDRRFAYLWRTRRVQVCVRVER